MQELIKDRAFKIDRILEEYDKRKTQKEVAEIFSMNIVHISWVTQKCNYKHTRKITQENRREDELIYPLLLLDEFEFLDQYPIENFRK